MRWIGLCALAAACAPAATPAVAQTLPNQPIMGVVAQQTPGACLIKRGPVLFQRKFSAAIARGTKIAILLEEIFAGLDSANLNIAYELSGNAVMTFSTATSGNIRFRQLQTAPQNYYNPVFGGYSESFNATTQQMTVRFNILFPNCVLPIVVTLDPIL